MASNALEAWPSQAIVPQSGGADSMPDILYVMGTGRSGTTILEVLLTNEEGIASAGEVKHVFRDAFVRNLQCACGKSGHDCSLWSPVLAASGWDRATCQKMGDTIERLESHGNFPSIYWRRGDAATTRIYEEATTAVFRSVARITGNRVVVDSSKYPARALMLAQLYPGKVKVLCITRSAAGLIAAFQKRNEAEQRPKSVLAVAAYYVYVLLCMALVRTRLKERCFAIRFEDLNRDPLKVLADIERWSGYSLATARAKIAAGDWFDVGHIMTGNRLRKKGKVKFDPGAAKAVSSQATRQPRLLSLLLERYRTLLNF